MSFAPWSSGRWYVGALIAYAMLRHKLRIYMQYRGYIAIWMISGASSLVLLMLWHQVSVSFPISPNAVAAYFAVAFFSKQITTMWVSDDLASQISEGELDYRLCRPVPVFFELAAAIGAGGIMRALPALAISLIVVTAYGALSSFEPQRLPLYLVSMAISWGIQFALSWTVGTLAFVLNEVRPIILLHSAATAVFGGMLAPIQLLPKSFADICMWLPFYWTFGFPIGILVPAFKVVPDGYGLILAASWLGICSIFAWWLWNSLVVRTSRL